MKKLIRTISIDAKELYFSAAHWIPNHEQCGKLHGHTYYVKKLELVVEGFVDFGDIKKAIKSFDHLVLVPECDSETWIDVIKYVNSKTGDNWKSLKKVFSKSRMIIDTDLPGTTVERIAEELKEELEKIEGVKEVFFTLTEGPTAGRMI